MHPHCSATFELISVGWNQSLIVMYPIEVYGKAVDSFIAGPSIQTHENFASQRRSFSWPEQRFALVVIVGIKE